MDKKKLKDKLHQYIENTDDESALNMLHEAVVEYARAENKDTNDELKPEQLDKLKESLQQLDSGDWKSHEEVKKLSRTWLKK